MRNPPEVFEFRPPDTGRVLAAMDEFTTAQHGWITLLAWFDASAMCALFAASLPERTSALVLGSPVAKWTAEPDFASPGQQFGPGGESWLRFNCATPRPILEEALGRLEDAFRDLRVRR